MAGNVKLLTSAGGGVVLDTATTTATDVTVKVPVTGVNNGTLVCSDSSGNVGIGTSSPQGKFQIGSLTSGTSEATYKGDAIIQGGPNALEATGGLEYKTSTSGSGYGWKVAALNTTNDPLVFGNRANSATWTERMRIDSSGNLLVGTTDASTTTGVGFKSLASTTVPQYHIVTNTSANSSIYHLYNTNATNNGYRFYVNCNGGISNYSGNNANLSDVRTKTNIELSGDYLNKICSIPVKLFNYKDEPEGEQRTLGVIAQDVEAVAPELVNNEGFGETPEGEEPLKSIYTTDMMFAMMKAIQELSAKNDALEARIAALEAK